MGGGGTCAGHFGAAGTLYNTAAGPGPELASTRHTVERLEAWATLCTQNTLAIEVVAVEQMLLS